MNAAKARFTLRIPEHTFLFIKNEAEKTGVSINAFILRILRDWADQTETKGEDK